MQIHLSTMYENKMVSVFLFAKLARGLGGQNAMVTVPSGLLLQHVVAVCLPPRALETQGQFQIARAISQ